MFIWSRDYLPICVCIYYTVIEIQNVVEKVRNFYMIKELKYYYNISQDML